MNKRLQDQIDKRNAVFKAATKAEKRVLIAKDVLQQLRARKFVASRGIYSFFDDGKIKRNEDGVITKKVCVLEYLQQPGAGCTVCGIGSLMVSEALFGKKTRIAEVEGVGSPNHTGHPLRDLFAERQLSLIETAFEQRLLRTFRIADRRLVDAAMKFGWKYGDDEDRLRAIMENIIENNGAFCPLPGARKRRIGHRISAKAKVKVKVPVEVLKTKARAKSYLFAAKPVEQLVEQPA